MSIAISLKINDGVVLAADSASTLMGQVPAGQPNAGQTVVVNTYNNANKVFNLVKGLPIGLLTWGAGSIGTDSISTLVKDLRDRLSGRGGTSYQDWKLNENNYTIPAVATRVRQFMYDEKYIPAFQQWPQKPAIGFIVAGYSASAGMADEYLIEVNNGQCADPRPLRQNNETGVTWGGVGEAMGRLFMGFSPALLQRLPPILRQTFGNVSDQAVAGITSSLQASLQVPVIQPAMPLQDAIDLAEFMVDLTIKWVRFIPGAPTVGGPIELAAITKHERFRWVQRKYWFKTDLNPEESWQR